jgi:hypothetical protein
MVFILWGEKRQQARQKMQDNLTYQTLLKRSCFPAFLAAATEKRSL